MNQANAEHRRLVAEANASVGRARALAEKDPLRPAFHLMAPARSLSDPNGPVFHNNEYHMFYQHDPFTNSPRRCHWGHAVSKDLVRWEHWPIALAPASDGYDSIHIASGCCVVHEGVPTIIYTGMYPREATGSPPPSDAVPASRNRHEVQCIAQSYDGMKTWTKHPGNPVIATRPRGDLVGFRDPFAWREDDLWYMLVGSGIKGEGGTALLYRSADLVEWECLNPLCVGFGEIWECPNFFPLGDRHALVVSPHGSVKYSIGDYVGHRFTPGPWRELDLGGESGFYAPNCLEDGKGRRIMWGWIGGGGAEGYPWNGLLTLPRVLTLRADGRLGIEPAEELRSLRGEHHRCGPLTLTPTSPNVLGGMKGDCLEIIAEFEPGDARLFGLEVLRSPDGKEKTVIGYDRSRKRLALGDKAGDFDLVAGEETLRLLVFVDRSVVEVYANGRECMTNRAYPGGADSLGLSLFAEGGSVRVRSLAIWRLKSIW